MVANLLAASPSSVNAVTADGDTPLLSAILSANPLPLVTLLCERGADIEARDYRMGNTPLILAVARPMGAQMAELLLSRGACATLPNAAGDTPVHAAAFAGGEGALRSLRLLLKHGALINAPGHNGETALHVAARRGHVAVVRFLLEKANADVLARTISNGLDAFHLAAEMGHSEVCACLLFHKAAPTAEATSALQDGVSKRMEQTERNREFAQADVNLASSFSPEWAKRVGKMLPIMRRLLVHNDEPSRAWPMGLIGECSGAIDNLSKYRGALAALNRTPDQAVLRMRSALSTKGCAALRDAVDAIGQVTIDSVDGLPNRDLAVPSSLLAQLVGPKEAKALLDLPYAFLQANGGLEGRAAEAAAKAFAERGEARVQLAGSFARRYCADTSGHEQPLTSLHFDSAALTVNVALSSDADVDGGRLLGVYDGKVHNIERGEGDATVHSSALLHGVTRMRRGVRYSLILFFAIR